MAILTIAEEQNILKLKNSFRVALKNLAPKMTEWLCTGVYTNGLLNPLLI